MNIQSYIDRKRIAGAREHEGRQTDWAGWEQPQFWAAIAGELLDAVAYAQQAAKVSTLASGVDFNESISCEICQILNRFLPKIIEAACQEAEAKVNKNIFNCPHCNTELLLWDELPDNSYIPDDVNVICCKECCEEFNVIIHNKFEFEVKQEAENG